MVNTAVKTTGYLERRLVRVMEDVRVEYDGTVRNSHGNIIQFAYGEDGFDATRVEDQLLDFATLDEKQFYEMYQHENVDKDFGIGYLPAEISEKVRNDFEARALLEEEFAQLQTDRRTLCQMIPIGKETKSFPCNLRRIIWEAQNQTWLSNETLHPTCIINSVRELIENLISLNPHLQQTLFDIHARSFLASKRIWQEFELGKDAFEWILGEIHSQFMRSIIQPGEMVGTIAAQSIAEPATQMSLDTFHFAGISAKNVTLGVPRVVEILNVTKTKAPSMEVYLLPNCM